MPRTKKTTDVKATDKKTVKAAPAEEVKFAELVVEPDKKAESKAEAKKEAAVAPAKAETKTETPKKAGRKPTTKKAAAPAKAKKETKAIATDTAEKKVRKQKPHRTASVIAKENAAKEAAEKAALAPVVEAPAPAPFGEKKEPEKKVRKQKPHRTASVIAKEMAAKKAAEKAERATKRKAKAEEKATAPEKKPAVKSSSGETIKVQFGGAEYDIEAIRQAVEADRKANVKGRVKTLEIYVKPEDHAVYYVVNSDGGHKIDL